MKPSQRDRILALLITRGQVTNHELNQVCFRYAARIMELRNVGHNITSKRTGSTEWTYTYHDPMRAAA